ncbi:expressed protein [Echinococcus multilocularis]|uniref:Expressed protein n=1 Tax=Echinococcus multilocularis TaxID=6211 RepID=A0A068XXT9_ECHMU|nr:expressed protein [Echinococcus multilocularis]
MGAKACRKGNHCSTDECIAANCALPTRLHDHIITTTSVRLLSAAPPECFSHCICRGCSQLVSKFCI